MDDCLFCKIARGEIPSTKIYEDEHIYAFLDINPTNIGHTLVIPKKHYENIHETPKEVLHKIMTVVKKITPAIEKGVGADGSNILMNNGCAAGQIIFHSHTHIVPRFINDGFRHWSGKRKYKEREEKETAEKIKSEIR